MDGNTPHDAEALLADLSWVQGLARSLLRDAGAGDDVAQEAWLAALRREEPPSRAWLAGTVRNLAARWWRDQGRRGRRELESARSEALPSTSELIEKNELQQVVAQEVLELDEPFRTSLLLRYQEGLKPNRIAARQGVPADTVRWRLRKGERLLRERFERRVGDDWRRSLAVVAVQSLSKNPWWTGLSTLGTNAALNVGLLAGAVAVVITGAYWFTSEANAAERISANVSSATFDRTDTERLAGPDSTRNKQRVLLVGQLENEVFTEDTASFTDEPIAECVLLGLVIDEHGEPLVGARVQLTTIRWGRSTTTRENGEFRLETDLPPGHATLRITADPFHEKLLLTVGSGRGFKLARFVPGQQDLGVFSLGVAGVVTGRVASTTGEALAANVRPVSDQGQVPQEIADAFGLFEIGHIPPGDWQLGVTHPGMASLTRSVEIKGGEVTNVDVLLERGPTVAGIVIDEKGEPLEGVQLFPVAGLAEWSVRSGPDGRFEVTLSSNEPHEIRARARGYEPALRRRIRARPGDTNLRILMRPTTLSTLRVVDDGSGYPIEFYWLAIERGGTREIPGELPGHPDPRMHEDGVVFRNARPGSDWVTVVAPDYLQKRFLVESETMDLRLSRGPALTGRLLFDGEPVAGAELRLKQQERVPMHGENDRIAGRFGKRIVPDIHALDPDPPEHDPHLLVGEVRMDGRTDSEGRFRITGIPAGRWRFLCRPQSSHDGIAPVLLDFEMGEEEGVDLGDLELPRSATIQGRVRLEDNELAGHSVSSGGVKNTRTDAQGGFVLKDVPPGDCWLRLQPSPDVVAPPQLFYLRIVEGEVRNVELTLPVRPAVRFELSLRLNGKALEGVQNLRFLPVSKSSDVAKAGSSRSAQSAHGVLNLRDAFDASGTASMALPELGLTMVELELESTRLRATLALDLRDDFPPEITVDFHAGAIEVHLPQALDLRTMTQVGLRVQQRGEAGATTTIVRTIENGHLLSSSGIILDESSDGRILFEPVPAGSLDVTVLVFEGEVEAALPGGFKRALLVSPAGLTPLHLR